MVEGLAPLQRRLEELSAEPQEVVRILHEGADRARALATVKMERVRAVTGLGLP